MKRQRYVLLILILLIAIILSVSLVNYFAPPPERRFVRYRGQQPELKIDLQLQSDDASQVPLVVEAARNYFNQSIKGSHKYWPEPVQIHEREADWWVTFKKKERVMLQGGDEVVHMVLPGGVTVSVDKESLSCTFVPSL